MSLALKDYQSNIEIGLGTFTYTAALAGVYFVSAQSSVLPPSGLSIVINQNGSPVMTSAAPSAAEQTVNLQDQINCAASDVITVVISSSNANDLMLNTVKTIITLNYQGTP
jgi:hypothetical protein